MNGNKVWKLIFDFYNYFDNYFETAKVIFFDRTSVHSNLFRHKGGSKKKTDEISILKQNWMFGK